MRKKINEEEDIGIRKCRTKSPIDKYSEEVRGSTSSMCVNCFSILNSSGSDSARLLLPGKCFGGYINRLK